MLWAMTRVRFAESGKPVMIFSLSILQRMVAPALKERAHLKHTLLVHASHCRNGVLTSCPLNPAP